MSPRRARVLLILTAGVITGYALRFCEAAYGWNSLLILVVLVLLGWSFGYVMCFRSLADETAAAKRELEGINRQLSQLQDGGLYRAMTVHPAGKARLQALPKQAER